MPPKPAVESRGLEGLELQDRRPVVTRREAAPDRSFPPILRLVCRVRLTDSRLITKQTISVNAGVL
jgi:hypothetical protein